MELLELLKQVSTNTQLLFPVAAVAVVLFCAALVFILGFGSAEQPQFDKLSLVLGGKKSSNKKKKTKDKKSVPNRVTTEDAKVKSDNSKKSPVKEKKEERVKEPEKSNPKEKQMEVKISQKDISSESKKGKKKGMPDVNKPVDYDDADWQEVPKKNEKKKVKATDDKEKVTKKASPAKKTKKSNVDTDVEAARPSTEAPVLNDSVQLGPGVDDEEARALVEKVEEFKRLLKEAEEREQAALNSTVNNTEEEEIAVEELTDVKDLRSNKKKENKEKQNKKKAIEAASQLKNVSKEVSQEKDSDVVDKPDEKQNIPVFDELGDTSTDSKKSKKSKKKARKDQ